jgi:hypothetical protein
VVSQESGKMPTHLNGGFAMHLDDLAIIHPFLTPNWVLSFQTTKLTRSHW